MDAKRHDEPSKDTAQVRVNYELPVTLAGDDAAGARFSETTTAENVTRRGAFVATERSLVPGARLAIRDAEDSVEPICDVQVVWVRVAADGTPGVGVKLVGPNERWMSYLVAHSVQALEDDPSLME